MLFANHVHAREHVFHLLLRIGVVDLEVLEIVEHVRDPRANAFVAIIDAAGHLALDHRPVFEVVAVSGRQTIGLGQGSHGVINRRHCLLLHVEDAGQLFPQLAPCVIELADCVFLGDDSQANFAALADIRSPDRVKIACIAVESDHGPYLELQLGQFPSVRNLLVLGEARRDTRRILLLRRPERNGDFRVRLRVAGRQRVDKPGGVEAEVVIEGYAHRDRGVGRNVAIGPRFVDDHAWSLIAKPPHVVPHRFAVAKSLGVFQIKPEREVPFDWQRCLETSRTEIEGQLECLWDRRPCVVRRGPAACSPDPRAPVASPPGRGVVSGRGQAVAVGCPCTQEELT